MDRPDIRLIGLDLDGTVFTDEKKITDKTKLALERAIQKGIAVVPVTGRPLSGLKGAREFMEIPGVNYAITSNGAAIYDLTQKECIFLHPLSSEKVVEVLQKIQGYPLIPDCFIRGEGHIQKDNQDKISKLPVVKAIKEYLQSSRVFVDDLQDYVSQQDNVVEKITINFFADEQGELLYGNQVRKLLEDISGITVVSGAPHNQEINLLGVSKSRGLYELGKKLGISMEQIMVCGDGENDREMIKDAGFGVAMGNAAQCVKDVADYVTKSNEEDGVAYVLEQYVL